MFDKITLFYEGIYLNKTNNNWTTLAMQLDPTLLNSSQIQQPCIQVNQGYLINRDAKLKKMRGHNRAI